MEYILKSSAIIFIFYGCYKLFLQKDTFFEANRWFLLAGLVIASCISLVVIPNYIEYTPVNFSNYSFAATSPQPTHIVEGSSFDYSILIYGLYWVGVLFFTGQLSVQLLSLRRVLKNGTKITDKHLNIIETHEDVSPFSFFNYIVYNPKHFDASELEHVINHEKAHSQQLHSLDNIIVHIACILLWFNPFVWLYKKALQQNLEFIADQKAQYISPCEKSYQTVLLKTSIQNQELLITNNFYTSLIKKRIVMLHKSKSKKWHQFKLLIALPLLACFVMSFNIEDIYVEASVEDTTTSEQDNETIEIIITKNTSDADLEVIKKDLSAKGITFTYKNIKRNNDGEIMAISTEFKSEKSNANYAIEGDDNGIKPFKFKSSDGLLNVGTLDQNTFIFESKDNKTKAQSTNSTNKVIVIEDEDSNETIDVKTIKNSDTIHFVQKNRNSFSFSTDDDDANIFIHETDDPIFIINGKKVEKSLFEDVDSDDIESIFVLKGDDAIKKFGTDGKNGVIYMTKKGSKALFPDSDKDVIFETKSRFHIDSDGKNSPLIIVDGEVVDNEDIEELNPNTIDNVEVIKEGESIKVYGQKGKNGVIKIQTKRNRNLNNNNDTFVFVERSNSKTVYETQEVMIDKSMSNAKLDHIESQLEAMGIDAKFSKVRRNKAGEITSIKISLDDNNGSKSTSSWREKTKAIPNIALGKHGKKLFIKAL